MGILGLFEPADLFVNELLQALNCGVPLLDDALQILALLFHQSQLLLKPSKKVKFTQKTYLSTFL